MNTAGGDRQWEVKGEREGDYKLEQILNVPAPGFHTNMHTLSVCVNHNQVSEKKKSD